MTSQANPSAEFAGDKPPCDIIMKGGITSGVVYPLAVLELARKYRFKNVGGTSAGALAAVLTAAGEYGREHQGFERIGNIPAYVSGNLLSFFQPVPKLKPLFSVLLASMRGTTAAGKACSIACAAIRSYWVSALLGAAPGLVFLLVMALLGAVGWAFLGLLIALLGLLLGVALRLKRAIGRELPTNGFGMCTGLTQPGHDKPALTDWLTGEIDSVAGRIAGETASAAPLTFGNLIGSDPKHPRINLSVMTTNLSMRRPYRLPFHTRTFLFRRSEFDQLFPRRVVDHMVAKTQPFPDEKNQREDFHYFPDAEHLPIVVAARMSLSFPGLISAVPLYARDFTLRKDTQDEPQKCWFSDGGLSSNFPIHFFDRLWPNAPTFAIALEDYVEERHEGEQVRMPKSARSGIILPIRPIEGLGPFLMSLLDAAKDWQDNLQSTLSGYRERIVRVALKPDEGGFNLTMPPDVIRRLTELGERAGKLAAIEFDMDEHRWRRFLVAMARIEETLSELLEAHGAALPIGESFATFLARYPANAKSYPQSQQQLKELMVRADELVKLARDWQRTPRVNDCDIPRPSSDLRITPKQ